MLRGDPPLPTAQPENYFNSRHLDNTDEPLRETKIYFGKIFPHLLCRSVTKWWGDGGRVRRCWVAERLWRRLPGFTCPGGCERCWDLPSTERSPPHPTSILISFLIITREIQMALSCPRWGAGAKMKAKASCPALEDGSEEGMTNTNHDQGGQLITMKPWIYITFCYFPSNFSPTISYAPQSNFVW